MLAVSHCTCGSCSAIVVPVSASTIRTDQVTRGSSGGKAIMRVLRP